MKRWTCLLGLLVGACGADETPERVDGSPDATAAADAGSDAQAEVKWLGFDQLDRGGDDHIPALWTIRQPGGARPLDAPIATLDPPRATSTKAFRIQGAAGAPHIDLSTHAHEFTSYVTAVRFWARRGTAEARDLIVAVTPPNPTSEDYFAALAARTPWRARRLALGPDWQLFTVELAELAPLGEGTPLPLAGPVGPTSTSEIHLIVEGGTAYDVWIDDIDVRCAPGQCP